MSQGFDSGGGRLRTYSRAQRYGSNARILGRAQVSRLNADFLEAIMSKSGVQWMLIFSGYFCPGRYRSCPGSNRAVAFSLIFLWRTDQLGGG